MEYYSAIKKNEIHMELSLVLCDGLVGWDGGGEGGSRGRRCVYTHMADSLRCMAETNTTL